MGKTDLLENIKTGAKRSLASLGGLEYYKEYCEYSEITDRTVTAYPFLLSSEFLGCTHSLLLESALEKNGGNKDGILQPNLYPYTIKNASMLFFFLILSTFFGY